MKAKLSTIIISVVQSKKSSAQYVQVVDLENGGTYTLTSKVDDFTKAPVLVPVSIECSIKPVTFNRDGQSSTVLYVDDVAIKKS